MFPDGLGFSKNTLNVVSNSFIMVLCCEVVVVVELM